jgi:hypothetical protein
MLREAHRVLAPNGALFVYTHVRKNGWLAGGVRFMNAIARLFERVGWIDLRQERLRKSDHLNPLADYDDLSRVLSDCGFRLERITYYTPIAGAFIENVLMRIAERMLTRRAARTMSETATDDEAARAVRADAKDRLRRRGPAYLVVRVLTVVMKLDVWLFGRIRSGPFFALLRKSGPGG